MPKEEFVWKQFRTPTLLIIQQANEIIEEYQAAGFDLTLRQLYYQFVARGLLANKQSEYNRLGTIIGDARLAGYIDWTAIEDRTRNLQKLTHWDNPGQIIRSARYSFRLDHWKNQDYRPEVWIEKEALAGVIAPVCRELDVAYYACKGYVSLSEMWRAGQRFQALDGAGQEPVIIHLGDHDPSGIDMTRDIGERADMFSLMGVEVRRIALNMDQVEEHNPPPNPAKLTDSRVGTYLRDYGSQSWELDALEPTILHHLIQSAIFEFRDPDKLDEVLEEEKRYINILANIEENWESL